MDILLSRSIIIGAAIAGGALSLLAFALEKKEPQSAWPAKLNRLAYLFMGASVVLFVVNGFTHTPSQ